VAELDKFKD